MKRYALVAEGMTDLAVIERIAEGFFGNEAIINPLMPLRDATDYSRAKQETFSSWELVLEYLSTDQIQAALDTNDFLIIQIDTDQGEHEKFGMKFQIDGKQKSIIEIIDDCQSILISRLGKTATAENLSRIIFAIPVLSTECWLVGLHEEKHNHNIKTINNCEKRLTATIKSGLKKDYRNYSKIAKGFSKKKTLDRVRESTPCLDHFVSQLA